MEPLRVYPEDVFSVHYCAKGTRAFFKKYSLDYALFRKEGIPLEEIEALNDIMATKVAEYVRNGRK
ncbi:tail assembly protein [Shewanella phage S0112]|nr:tail assembly protein [Shewanella phage S0112]